MSSAKAPLPACRSRSSYFLGLACLLAILLAKTPFGRKVYAVGGNGVAATFSGIRRPRGVLMTLNLIRRFACGGWLASSQQVNGSQNTVGRGLELEFCRIILGVVSLLGGSGTVFKTLIGVLDPRVIQNGLLLVGLEFYVQDQLHVVTG